MSMRYLKQLYSSLFSKHSPQKCYCMILMEESRYRIVQFDWFLLTFAIQLSKELFLLLKQQNHLFQCHKIGTWAPWHIEFVETKTVSIFVPCIYSTAFLYQQAT